MKEGRKGKRGKGKERDGKGKIREMGWRGEKR